MARRLPFLVVLVALVVPLAMAGQPTVVLAAGDAPPAKALTPRLPDELNTYVITLQLPALANYDGGIPGLQGTSNAVTGAPKLNVNTPESQEYLEFLAERRDEFLRRASERLGREIEVGYIYDVVLNGVSVKLTAFEAARIADLPGLVRISPREKRQLLTDRGPQWIGAPSRWGSATACAASNDRCGEGIVMGVVDTGINMDHPSFADPSPDGYDYPNRAANQYFGWCNPSNPNYNSSYTCNGKLIGAYSFPASDMNPQDLEGHGSHTASTAAGNRLTNVLLDEPTIDLSFDISGVAPRAFVISYDACTTDGCNNDDLIAALEQAATDQVDALNYSISGSGLSPWAAEDELAFLSLRNAGAFVSASAGNSGPGPQTVAHGSPWLTTTAASTHDRALINAAINLTSSNGPLADIYGRSVTGALPAAPIVYAANYSGNNLCLPGVWAAGTFTNQIVVCDRGNNARVDKAVNVQAAGGDGMILANGASSGDEEIGDAYVMPGVHITYSEGVTLKNWLASGSGHQGGIQGTVNEIDANNGDVMAAFSSRGPNGQVPDLIKPDMTAPGVDILAAWATLPNEPAPELEIISGTSMSSPHMAGAGALMMQAKFPAWSISEIQSAMMTTSVWDDSVRKEDGVTPSDPFDRGAGRVNIANAMNAGLVMNITSGEYDAANPATGGDPKTLNYPSMADDNCYKSCGWTRTVRNTLAQPATWNGQFVGKDGLTATLTVPNLTINAGATQTLGVNIADVSGLTPGKWYFGHVVYTEANSLAPQFHLPVAVKVSASSDSGIIEKTATPTGAGTGAQITYNVTIKNKANSARTFSVSDVVPAGSTYVANSATGGWAYNSGTNTLSGNVNVGASQFVWNERNLSGYDPMAGRVPPANLGTLNRDTGCFSLDMDFYYLDTHYTEILVSMNGVVRAGIPTSPYCPSNTPLNIPSNQNRDENENILAPFWADLNMTGGNMYLVLTIFNGKPHTVIEWENALHKGTNKRVSFQLWIEDGTDNIWFSYPAGFNSIFGATLPVATIGAEDLSGSAGVKYYYYSGTGSASGNVPDGSVDVWVGLAPTTATLTFKANATAPANSNITNEASATVSSVTNTAWANTRICGPATATQPTISVQSRRYALVAWTADMHSSYELWRSASPYVTPGAPGSVKVFSGKASSFVDQAGGASNYYILRTLNCVGAGPADAAGVAKFDFALTPGN